MTGQIKIFCSGLPSVNTLPHPHRVNKQKLPMSAKHHCEPLLTVYQKCRIEGRRGLMSHGEISRQLDIPRPTISTSLKRLRERQSIDNIHRPGRPRKTSSASDHRSCFPVRDKNSSYRIKSPYQCSSLLTHINECKATAHLKWRSQNLCQRTSIIDDGEKGFIGRSSIGDKRIRSSVEK